MSDRPITRRVLASPLVNQDLTFGSWSDDQ